jgi:hypothetical protein
MATRPRTGWTREWYAGRTVADEGRSAAQDVQGRAQDAAGTVGGNASNG